MPTDWAQMTRAEIFEWLKSQANAAIGAASHDIGRAVNWADLSCRYCEYWIDSFGCSGYRVHLKEASPTAHELQKYVFEHIKQAGFPFDLDVRTEW